MIPGIRSREPRAIARAISLVENQDPRADALMAALHPETGHAMTLGVTGPPGAGKSTFVDRLVAQIAQTGLRVAVVAVDPASPFSGGAILGDRVRLGDHPGVYFRSMSSRGHLGGLALATEGAVAILDAAGFDVVIVETVGVGQSEIEVAALADTTLLVQPPHLGDGVQAVKAGIMEVPAIFVLNKADLPGARQAANEITQMLELGDRPAGAWKPPVLLVSSTAAENSGVAAVWEAIQRHWAYMREQGRLQAARARRAERLLWKEAERQLLERLQAWSASHPDAFEAIASAPLPPRQAAQRLLAGFLG